jgi:hypothetical protein
VARQDGQLTEHLRHRTGVLKHQHITHAERQAYLCRHGAVGHAEHQQLFTGGITQWRQAGPDYQDQRRASEPRGRMVAPGAYRRTSWPWSTRTRAPLR